MGKLNQVIAVVAGKKEKASKAITEAYHKAQKPELFQGIVRTYQPKDEDGDRQPPESKSVQVTVTQVLTDAVSALTDMYDVVATQDNANTAAKANIVVDGNTLLKDVPVTHLLFLEKQANDLATFVSKLPTLDPADVWTYDAGSDSFVTPPTESVRTKKVPKAFIKYAATKEHPAQVDTFTEDVQVGIWKTTKFSGAITAKQKNEWAERVRRLQEAIVRAREEANSTTVTEVKEGGVIFNYIFGK